MVPPKNFEGEEWGGGMFRRQGGDTCKTPAPKREKKRRGDRRKRRANKDDTGEVRCYKKMGGRGPSDRVKKKPGVNFQPINSAAQMKCTLFHTPQTWA